MDMIGRPISPVKEKENSFVSNYSEKPTGKKLNNHLTCSKSGLNLDDDMPDSMSDSDEGKRDLSKSYKFVEEMPGILSKKYKSGHE